MTDNCIDYTWSDDLSGTGTLDGEILPEGITIVTWTVDDQHGQTTSCEITITIEDDQSPSISCPNNASRVTEPDVCYYTVNGTEFDPLMYSDNCLDLIVTNSRNGMNSLSGEQLEKGVHAIIWTIDDQHGQTDTCIITITVNDDQPPGITCLDDITVNTDNEMCTYTVSGSEFDPPSVIDNCLDFTISNNLTATTTIDGAVLDTGMHVIVWVVDDQHGHTATCSMTITIIDVQSPDIICQANDTHNADPGLCSYTISGTEYDPILVDDNCSDYFFFNNLNATTTLDGYVLPVGNHTIIWTVDDDHGQVATCSMTLMIEDNQPLTISCPSNQVRLAGFGTCTYTVSGTEFNPLALADNCGDYFYYNNVNFSSTLAEHVFPVGTHNITWTINDGHGQMQNCVMTVNILDIQPPTIQCPDDVSLSISSAVCDTAYDYTTITADNCPAESVSLLSGIGSGNGFPMGINQEILQVEDNSGNTASCSFDVTVEKIPDMVLDTICYGDSILLEGMYQYLPGVFTDTLQNVFACDSIVIMMLDTTTYCIWPTEIVYVDSSAIGENTGVDWDNAYLDLQLALDVADRYLNVRQVWVAEATYYPTPGSNRNSAFILTDSTWFLGGFLGFEADSSEREPDLYPAYLSGDIGIQNDDTDNSYHVVINPSTNTDVHLDGFVILNGNADGIMIEDQSGAGLTNYGIMHLANSHIMACSSVGLGSLIYNTGASASLTLKNASLIGMTPAQVWNADLAELHIIAVIDVH